MTDYAIVKLSNGENIICRVVQKTDSEITITITSENGKCQQDNRKRVYLNTYH